MRGVKALVAAAWISTLGACHAEPASHSQASDQAWLESFRSEREATCVRESRVRWPDPREPIEAQCACAYGRLVAGRTAAEIRREQEEALDGDRFTAIMRRCIVENPGPSPR